MMGKVLVAGCAGVASLIAVSSAMAAEPFDSKLQAAIFNSKLVQAQDECLLPTTQIGGLDACAPSNTLTASGEQFSVGKILVKSKAGPVQVLGLLKSSGNGDVGNSKALAGKNLHVRLTLRVTKRSGPLTDPATTWSDQVLNCASPGVIGSNGNFLFKGGLVGATGCNLNPLLGNNAYEKEIVSAEIVDTGSGKTVAVPGVRKK